MSPTLIFRTQPATVKDLIAVLQNLPPYTEVYVSETREVAGTPAFSIMYAPQEKHVAPRVTIIT